MLILTQTITCKLPDAEDVLEHLETEHKKQHFRNDDDVYDEIQDILSDYIDDDEVYDFFGPDIDEYLDDIKNTFLDAHSEIERLW